MSQTSNSNNTKQTKSAKQITEPAQSPKTTANPPKNTHQPRHNAKKEFFATLEKVLFCDDFATKKSLFNSLYDDFLSENLYFEHDSTPQTRLNLFTPAPIVEPSKLTRAKGTSPLDATAHTLHSIAHIEFCAITLALDSVYRFRHLPAVYYADWLAVAREEMAHFSLLADALAEIGYKYGDFSAHAGLYDAMTRTASSLAHRMGVVHRGLEARGLDANPFVLAKLKNIANSATSKIDAPIFGKQIFSKQIFSKIEEVFGVILRDEISHVNKGDRWWRFAIEDVRYSAFGANATNAASAMPKADSDSAPLTNGYDAALRATLSATLTRTDSKAPNFAEEQFLALCADFDEFILAGKILNTKARLKAGFSTNELQLLENFYKTRKIGKNQNSKTPRI